MDTCQITIHRQELFYWNLKSVRDKERVPSKRLKTNPVSLTGYEEQILRGFLLSKNLNGELVSRS